MLAQIVKLYALMHKVITGKTVRFVVAWSGRRNSYFKYRKSGTNVLKLTHLIEVLNIHDQKLVIGTRKNTMGMKGNVT